MSLAYGRHAAVYNYAFVPHSCYFGIGYMKFFPKKFTAVSHDSQIPTLIHDFDVHLSVHFRERRGLLHRVPLASQKF
jgi:hypothetical protein